MCTKGPPSYNDSFFDSSVWKKILVAFCVNLFIVPLTLSLIYYFGFITQTAPELLAGFKSSYPQFFHPLNKIDDFFLSGVLRPAVLEEFAYRGPVRILLGLVFVTGAIYKRPAYVVAIILGLALNFLWAVKLHRTDQLLWLPIFISGLCWLWLTMTTKRIWPAQVAHGLGNFSIYILLKFASVFALV